jgi:hypothetical protein
MDFKKMYCFFLMGLDRESSASHCTFPSLVNLSERRLRGQLVQSSQVAIINFYSMHGRLGAFSIKFTCQMLRAAAGLQAN